MSESKAAAEAKAKAAAEAEAALGDTPDKTPEPAPILMTQEQIQAMIDAAVSNATKGMKADLAKVAEDRPLPTVNVAQTADQTAYLNEEVPVKLFKDNGKYKDDVFVIVNGKTWQIMRGVSVMVPRYVAMALDASDKQEADASDYLSGLQATYQQKQAMLN